MGTTTGEKDRRRSPRAALAATVLLLATGGAPLAAADGATGAEQGEEIDFEIASESLGEALTTFGMQSGLQVSFAPELVEGKRSVGLSGRFTAAAGLDELLSDTGLEYEFVNGSTVVIRRAQPPPAPAGAPTGSLTGRVTSAGEPVAGVTVTATSASLESPRTATTDEEGRYQLPDLPPGAYSLRFELQGLVPVVEEVEVSPDESTDLDVQMSLHEVREDIIVTGTRIRGVPPVSSPVTTYDREDIERTGYSTLVQFVESLPQNFNGGATQDSIGTEGSVGNRGFGNAPNLRALGPGATLVLLNGRRIAPGGNTGQFIDVSMIPLSAIERVEILTDGASAIYGADAVGGVINMITRADYEGVDTILRYGDVTSGGAGEVQASQSFARSWTSGNAMAVFEHHGRDPLRAADRDFASTADPTTTLLPEQERQSLYASITQDLGLNTSVFGNALYSVRDSKHRQVVNPGELLDRQEAENSQRFGSLGLRLDMGADWSGEVVGSYSDYSLDSRFDRAGEVTEATVDTETLSLDALVDGSLYALPAGDLGVALGAGYRQEKVDTILDDELSDRNVRIAFGELLIPIFGAAHRRSGLEALEISLAARYEDSSDFGDEITPKYGLRWSPAQGLSLRGTYGKSFKAPTLAQLAGGTESFLAFIPSDFGFDVAGDPLIFARTQNAQPQLEAEESTNWTAGFDLQPERVPFTLGVTYYDIDFTGRIGDPAAGGFAEFFNTAEAFGDLIVQNPGVDLVNSLLADATSFLDLTGGVFSPETVDLFADLSITNIAAERQSGVELSLDYPFDTGWGHFDASLHGNYITEFERTVTPASPTVSADNVLYGPVDLRLRGGVTWSQSRLSTSLFANYHDDYRVSREPDAERIASWLTFDLHLRYVLGGTRSGSLDGMSVALSAQNLLDRDPPFVAIPDFINANPGYDPTNADPLGRFVALSISKSW